MKVLLISSKYQPEYSGSGLRAHNTYKRFKRKFNIDYDVVASSLENTGFEKYIYDEVNVLRIAGLFKVANFHGILRKLVVWINMPFEVIRSWLFIRNKINEYYLLHSFGDSWVIGFLTWYFAKQNKAIMRELCNDIETPYYPKPFKRWIKPIFQKDNTVIVAISPMLEKLAKNNGVKNVWQRPNPIDESKFNLNVKKQKYQLRKKLTKFNKNDVILCSVANFSDRKNQMFLLKVLKLLPKKYKLFLGGVVHNDTEGGKASISSVSYIDNINSYVDKNSLKSRVQIKTDFIGNPQEYMALSDVYLFPSKHEGLGTPILETQSLGVPIVANKLDGITDKWIKEGTGGYSSELNEDLWIDKINNALNIKTEKLKKNAQNIINQSKSELIDKQYFKFFKELANAKPN